MMSPSDNPTGLLGHLLDAPESGELRSIPDGAIVVEKGKIAARGKAEDLKKDPRWQDVFWRKFDDHIAPVILPGLIDVHTHIPQYPAISRPESGLLPWLNRYIFPLEKEFRGAEQRPFLEAFFQELTANGTTTAMLYSAVWEESTDLAFQVAEAHGIRAIIGKVMMDVGSYGDLQTETDPTLSLDQTRRLCKKWHGAADGRLEYAVSPRFAVTCSAELMRGAADIAKEYDAYLQTHLSENHGEIARVAELFPDTRDYTHVYKNCGLLSNRMVLGHCIHLSRREIDTLAEADARIAHCPTSNLFLNSGLFPMDRLREAGLKIGLASDVAGGPEINLWQVMRSAIEIQKARRFIDESVPELSAAQALHLATQGGADVLNKSETIGTLDEGKEADISIFDLNKILPFGGKHQPDAPIDAETLAALLIYRGSPQAHIESRVRGKLLKS